ncbi:MAG TPA: CarD family transcriptional regulator, partial [Candidatus Polarisedimenticolaceae bacterium]|nr:CarD family transcriptional regulator [Candidatus Polarisedimenticolaceae bacterium]
MASDLALWSPLTRAPFFEQLERRSAAGEPLCLTGLVEGSRALVLSLWVARGGGPLILVVPDDSALAAYGRDLAAFATVLGRDPSRIVTMPALDADPYDNIAPHPEVVRERVLALDRLGRGALDVLLLPARTLLNPLPDPERWRSWTRVISTGDDLPPERFVLSMMELGYRRVDIVGAPGEISRRGGIVDVFPPTAEQPVRIELFGDAVDSLRAFDTDNQRSTGQLDRVVVVPASENPPTEAAIERLASRLEGAIRRTDAARSARAMREQLARLQGEGIWPGFESLAGLACDRPGSLLDYAIGHCWIVDEAARTEEELLRAAHESRMTYEQSDNRWLPPPDELFRDPVEVRERLGSAALFLQELAGDEPPQVRRVHAVPSRSARHYAGRVPELVADLGRAAAEGVRTVCLMRAPGSAGRLREILAEYDLVAGAVEQPIEPAREAEAGGGLFVGVAGLRAGFELPQAKLVVLAERDVFAEEPKSADRKPKGRTAFLSDFRDLKPGSFVVHVDHGIARYGGLGRPKGGSLNRDFMVLEFDRGDRLFVPVDRLDLVQKYNGVAGAKPRPDRLGGPGWSRLRTRVRESVESMARELLELYARRQAARGIAFSPDTPWQQELEGAFPFELTPDQRRALAEIKADMEASRTMDRLLVGDVGFGKTEVALRAAFAAA